MSNPAELLRIVVFGPERRVGALDGDLVVDLHAADPEIANDLESLIGQGNDGLERVRDALAGVRDGRAPNGATSPVERTRLCAPAVRRPRIGCAAGNYAAHSLGSAARKGVTESRALSGLVDTSVGAPLPTPEDLTARTRERATPRGFWKDFALPFGPEDGIPYPSRAELFDYEGEVAVVIGRAAKDVPTGEGGSYVWGVTLLSDWSIRGQSQKDSLTFNLSKNFDGGASIGPCIVVGGLDPSALTVETRVNGDLRQHYDSRDMIFDHAQFIEYLSRDFTLLPGDMISGGSGPGSATDFSKGDPPDLSLFLKVGDLVEVSSEPIGVLRNRIVVA